MNLHVFGLWEEAGGISRHRETCELYIERKTPACEAKSANHCTTCCSLHTTFKLHAKFKTITLCTFTRVFVIYEMLRKFSLPGFKTCKLTSRLGVTLKAAAKADSDIHCRRMKERLCQLRPPSPNGTPSPFSF